jgi:hypothetical protein
MASEDNDQRQVCNWVRRRTRMHTLEGRLATAFTGPRGLCDTARPTLVPFLQRHGRLEPSKGVPP